MNVILVSIPKLPKEFKDLPLRLDLIIILQAYRSGYRIVYLRNNLNINIAKFVLQHS